MMSAALVRRPSSMAWELRTAWASGRRVALSLERCCVDRVEGHVQRIAATGAFVTIASVQYPLERVLAVHSPSRLGDTDYEEDSGKRWHRRGRRREPQRERLL